MTSKSKYPHYVQTKMEAKGKAFPYYMDDQDIALVNHQFPNGATESVTIWHHSIRGETLDMLADSELLVPQALVRGEQLRAKYEATLVEYSKMYAKGFVALFSPVDPFEFLVLQWTEYFELDKPLSLFVGSADEEAVRVRYVHYKIVTDLPNDILWTIRKYQVYIAETILLNRQMWLEWFECEARRNAIHIDKDNGK